ncbi:hypothetical protein GWK91_00310 [Virgibacillus sp. MSP4-1]|uniref:hypothetical protein n=1 Tax=Virgibacillus sp. MSP4-1 TaxID=2700081 RepID=UPI0003AAAD8A|nr:hypothetical protein [Virgibacillus sp. MSP4-1]QHS21492.1 hypothetical protein GWK91_00310 [Virgibacillus sp. MSP4-1]
MIEKINNLGWKKILFAVVGGTISLFALAFTLIFGLLLLLSQFDDRYFQSDEYKLEMESNETGAQWEKTGSQSRTQPGL